MLFYFYIFTQLGCSLEATIVRTNRKNEPHTEKDVSKDMPRNTAALGPGIIYPLPSFVLEWHLEAGSVVNATPEIEEECRIKQYVKHIQEILAATHTYAVSRISLPPDEPLHPFKPGDQVLLKTWQCGDAQTQFSEKWSGPYDVLLTTHTSLKLAGVKPWVHHSRVKRAPQDDLETRTHWTCDPVNDLKFLFKKK